MKHGFTLVELSIVLVILGLLVGGILAGQSLIRASELRSVTTEQQRYLTATQAFRDKYFALPGDITNATAIWGKDNTNCAAQSGTAATPGTCNGDGDGLVTRNAIEMHRYWQQLSLAGLISGIYSGTAGGGGSQNIAPGTNSPLSRIQNAGWGMEYIGNYAGDNIWFALDYGHVMVFGAQDATYDNYHPVLKPEEAWNIDTKLDDGQPGYGKIVGAYWNNQCTSPVSGGTTKTNLNAAYRLTDSAIQCSLNFVKQF